jgi:hypothetical protein
MKIEQNSMIIDEDLSIEMRFFLARIDHCSINHFSELADFIDHIETHSISPLIYNDYSLYIFILVFWKFYEYLSSFVVCQDLEKIHNISKDVNFLNDSFTQRRFSFLSLFFSSHFHSSNISCDGIILLVKDLFHQDITPG